MNKKLITACMAVMLASCTVRHDPIAGETRSETGNDIITIDIGTKDIKYEKITIKDHDCWIRFWETKYGTGSDILHIEDLCGKCAGKSMAGRGDSGDDDTLDY